MTSHQATRLADVGNRKSACEDPTHRLADQCRIVRRDATVRAVEIVFETDADVTSRDCCGRCARHFCRSEGTYCPGPVAGKCGKQWRQVARMARSPGLVVAEHQQHMRR